MRRTQTATFLYVYQMQRPLDLSALSDVKKQMSSKGMFTNRRKRLGWFGFSLLIKMEEKRIRITAVKESG